MFGIAFEVAPVVIGVVGLSLKMIPTRQSSVGFLQLFLCSGSFAGWMQSIASVFILEHAMLVLM